VKEKRYSPESVGPRLDAFLESLLIHARLQLRYTVARGDDRHPGFEDPDVLVKFSGPDVDLLLENRAALLLALEHVSQEMLRMPPEDHARLCFDAHEFRALRIEELRLSAAAAADKVRRTGVPFRFNPMNSRERRIIHLALRDEAAVRSESAGEGPQRQVVIYPAGMPTPAAGAPPPPVAGFRRRRR
jgi:spoIIIJ-associated protein